MARVEAVRANRAVGAGPRMHALTLAVRIETRDRDCVRRAIRVVAARKSAIGVRAIVSTSEVAFTAVIGRRGGEVDRALVAPLSFPLVRAVAAAERNKTIHSIGIIVAVGEVTKSRAGRKVVVVLDAAIAAERGGVRLVDRVVDEGWTERAVSSEA